MVENQKTVVLGAAREAVYGARFDSYGDPRDNIRRVAALWSCYLGIDITPRDVCVMLILVKVSRDRNRPETDNLIDAAGYAEIAGLLTQPKEKP